MCGIGLVLTRGRFGAGSPIILDSFNRADNTVLGNADTGQVWTSGFRVVGISNNIATSRGISTHTDGHWVVDNSSVGNDVEISLTVTQLNTGSGIVIRHNGQPNGVGDDGYLCVIRAIQWFVYRWTNGILASTIASGSTLINTGGTAPIKATMKGTLLTFVVDGITVYSANPAGALTGNFSGIYTNSTSDWLDNFQVVPAP